MSEYVVMVGVGDCDLESMEMLDGLWLFQCSHRGVVCQGLVLYSLLIAVSVSYMWMICGLFFVVLFCFVLVDMHVFSMFLLFLLFILVFE